MLEVQEREGAVIFLLRVQPRASKDEIAGELGGALKVRLRAPAVETGRRAKGAAASAGGGGSRERGAGGIPGGPFEKTQVGC